MTGIISCIIIGYIANVSLEYFTSNGETHPLNPARIDRESGGSKVRPRNFGLDWREASVTTNDVNCRRQGQRKGALCPVSVPW